MPDSRVQMTVRLKKEDKELLQEKMGLCGIDGSVGARQILELLVLRLRSGGDYIDALHELKTLWKVP